MARGLAVLFIPQTIRGTGERALKHAFNLLSLLLPLVRTFNRITASCALSKTILFLHPLLLNIDRRSAKISFPSPKVSKPVSRILVSNSVMRVVDSRPSNSNTHTFSAPRVLHIDNQPACLFWTEQVARRLARYSLPPPSQLLLLHLQQQATNKRLNGTTSETLCCTIITEESK